MSALPKTYDDDLSRYLGANADRFRIQTPAGYWWPAWEHPGYLAWYPSQKCPGPVNPMFASGIGWNEPHELEADLTDHDTDKQYAAQRIDLTDLLTGELERDAEMVRRTIRQWLIDNARAVQDLCGASWVPDVGQGSKHAWGIPRRQNLDQLRERLKRV